MRFSSFFISNNNQHHYIIKETGKYVFKKSGEEGFLIQAQNSPQYNTFGAGWQLLCSETSKTNGICLQKIS